MKQIKLLIAALYAISLLALLLFELYLIQTRSALSISDFIYWWILIGWIYIVLAFKPKSKFSMVPAFVLFILGAIVSSFGINEIGETFMRTSFIGWVIVAVQALFESKESPEKK